MTMTGRDYDSIHRTISMVLTRRGVPVDAMDMCGSLAWAVDYAAKVHPHLDIEIIDTAAGVTLATRNGGEWTPGRTALVGR